MRVVHLKSQRVAAVKAIVVLQESNSFSRQKSIHTCLSSNILCFSSFVRDISRNDVYFKYFLEKILYFKMQ